MMGCVPPVPQVARSRANFRAVFHLVIGRVTPIAGTGLTRVAKPNFDLLDGNFSR